MTFPVFDLHCDTAFEMQRDKQAQKELLSNDLHIDLERAGELPGYAQCFACFTTPLFGGDPVAAFERELKTIQTQVAKNPDRIRFAQDAQAVQENFRQGICSAILTLEGPAGIGFDPQKLESLQRIGFRMSTLGWNECNPLTGSHATGGGLTDLGREYVREAQRLKMLIDVSHISDEGFWDIMRITDGPIVASHSNSRDICDMSRNLTDDMFRAICETDGVVGINLYTHFLGEQATLDTVCAHILHFLELDPTGRHICLGGDLDGCDQLPDGFSGIQDYNKLAERLLCRGLSEELVYQIFWNNALGVLNKCCM